MATLTSQRMKFYSRPYGQRAAFNVTSLSIVLGWVITALSFIIAGYAMHTFYLQGIVMIMAVCALSIFMFVVSYRFIQESKQKYELYVDGNLFVLSTEDKEDCTRTNQQIMLNDISSAEYYPARDTSKIVLHGKTHDMEIPLWSFGPQAEHKIVSYVQAHGINVVDVPGNVVI